MNSLRLSDNLRILLAFTLKDIRDAIQNKMILRVGVGTLMVWLSSMALPFLLSMRDSLDLRIYDPGRSEVVRQLAKDDRLDVSRMRFEQELMESVGGSFNEALGLVVDEQIDETIASDATVIIAGYYPHWMESDQVAALVAEVQAKFEALTGRSVQIDIKDGARYPSYQAGGRPSMISSALVIVIFTVGGMLTPFLMIEEKEKGTLSAILVSPASRWQFVLGKAMAGLFYSLIVVVVALAMSGRWIVHWDVAILAALVGSLFTVSIGLLVGVLTENPSGLGLWFGLFMMVMLVPVFLELAITGGAQSWWQVVLKWLPTVGFSDLIRASFVDTFPDEIYLRSLLSMIGVAGILLALVGMRLRRLEL